MRFNIEEIDIDNINELTEEQYESDMYAEEYDPELDNILEEINEENREKLVIDDDTLILLSLTTIPKDGKEHNIVKTLSISEDLLIDILKHLDYGNNDWERYVLMKERNILDERF